MGWTTGAAGGAVKTIGEESWRILAHWEEELSTAFMEGLNSVFGAVETQGSRAAGVPNTW